MAHVVKPRLQEGNLTPCGALRGPQSPEEGVRVFLQAVQVGEQHRMASFSDFSRAGGDVGSEIGGALRRGSSSLLPQGFHAAARKEAGLIAALSWLRPGGALPSLRRIPGRA